MSKSSKFSNPAFKRSEGISQSSPGFNLISQTNNFNSVFDVKQLEEKEAAAIEKLLVDGFDPGKIEEEKAGNDVITLKQITAEIKTIGRQGIVLMGERVHRAKELLKPYRDGTFTKWLESAFGTRKTGYNVLSYFELYNAISIEGLKEKFKKIPLRIAYSLASREGDLGIKEEIIRNHYRDGYEELAIIIQDRFPVSSQDKRVGKSSNERLLCEIRENLKKLLKRKDVLSEKSKSELSEIQNLLDSILS